MTTHMVSERGLARLDGYPFEARYSVGAEAEAVRLAELARNAYEYFTRVFPETVPKITARFLMPCGVPKLASCLQIADFSGCEPSFGTPQARARIFEATLNGSVYFEASLPGAN